MPIYEYSCPTCGTFEAWHKMTENIESCPTCERPVERRITGGAGFRFEGPGWGSPDKPYRNDGS